MLLRYSVHWGIKLSKPLFLGNPSPLCWFFLNPSWKIRFFSELQKYWSFSSLTTSYLLKFLVKISQSEYLVMTEKNIFVYQRFSSLHISDFIFYVKIATLVLLKKVTPSFPANFFQEFKLLSSPAPFFFKRIGNLVWGSSPPQQKGRGSTLWLFNFLF